MCYARHLFGEFLIYAVSSRDCHTKSHLWVWVLEGALFCINRSAFIMDHCLIVSIKLSSRKPNRQSSWGSMHWWCLRQSTTDRVLMSAIEAPANPTREGNLGGISPSWWIQVRISYNITIQWSQNSTDIWELLLRSIYVWHLEQLMCTNCWNLYWRITGNYAYAIWVRLKFCFYRCVIQHSIQPVTLWPSWTNSSIPCWTRNAFAISSYLDS